MSEEPPCPICGRTMELDGGLWRCACGHTQRAYPPEDER